MGEDSNPYCSMEILHLITSVKNNASRQTEYFFKLFFFPNSCLHSQIIVAPASFLPIPSSELMFSKLIVLFCFYFFIFSLGVQSSLWFPCFRFSGSTFIFWYLFLHSFFFSSTQPNFPVWHTRWRGLWNLVILSLVILRLLLQKSFHKWPKINYNLWQDSRAYDLKIKLYLAKLTGVLVIFCCIWTFKCGISHYVKGLIWNRSRLCSGLAH